MQTIQRSGRIFRILILVCILLLLTSILTPFATRQPQVVQAQTDGSMFGSVPIWSSNENDPTTSMAWGDVDNDGDLDLVVGNDGTSSRLYLNENDTLLPTPIWESSPVSDIYKFENTSSLAWGDVDNDGDLDLAVGDLGVVNIIGGSNSLYRNEKGTLTPIAVWISEENDNTTSLAWGDVDGDGDLDLAVGNGREEGTEASCQANRIYRNDNGVLANRAFWSSTEQDCTSSLAWADVDNDGDLDLAVANEKESNRIYRNEQGALQPSAFWSSSEQDITTSIAWGDVDNDGDPDLVVGNFGESNRFYRNNSGIFSTVATWSSSEKDNTTSIAWGDIDGDGWLDLLAGNRQELNKIYRNNGGTPEAIGTVWSTFEGEQTSSLALADIDNDGDLDLAVGNNGQPNRIYRNTDIGLHVQTDWSASEDQESSSAAWGDVDNDGDLDLAIGNGSGELLSTKQPNRLYHNDKGVLRSQSSWTTSEADRTNSIAWGDVDSDGDLDLAVGNDGEVNRLYLNEEGTLQTRANWSSIETEHTTSIAWGDVDNDNDLDLAVGNEGETNRIYLNNTGVLSQTASWGSAELDKTRSIAWGDVDGDGDLDLATGNYGEANRIYLNDGGTLQTNAVWSSAEADNTSSVAWGDVDGDGDLDLAVGNDRQPNRLYENVNGMLATRSTWRTLEAEQTMSVAWGDVDGDGDLDLATANYNEPAHVYRNEKGVLSNNASWSGQNFSEVTSVALGDVDNDGDLDMAQTGGKKLSTAIYSNHRDASQSIGSIPRVHIALPIGADTASGSADFYASAHIWETGNIPFAYTLTHPDSLPVREIKGYYSLDGGDNWQPAIASSDTQTSTLATSPGGTKHTYTWDVYASGVMGKSDNVVFRLVAIPVVSADSMRNHIPGPYMHGAYATATFPLRVRGTQVKVLRDNGTAAVGAYVYRLPRGRTSNATPVANQRGEPFTTDNEGNLQGRGQIQVQDKLVALLRTKETSNYTLYETSAAPNKTALDYHEVEEPGVQSLTVSPDNPLMLFDLEVSLEWDASQDEQFLSRLRYDLERTAELLYDWTNGQVALGTITVYHDRLFWHESNIRIYATNHLRPNANQGGIADDKFSERIEIGELPYPQNYATDVVTITYEPGQVRMGAVWNRFGGTEGNLSEDWPRTLAHELGHYALFLDDNYVGLDEDGVIVTVEGCPGAMSDQYNDDYSEYHPLSGWLPSCQKTFSNVSTGRSDWETITAFYPFLHAPQSRFQQLNTGPTILPLDVTHVQVTPITYTELLDVPIFYLKDKDGARLSPLPESNTRALLFQHDEQGNEWITDLGRPMRDQVTAWGARIGGRLCMYEPTRNRLGCHDPIAQGDEQLRVYQIENWQPDIIVTPVTSRTINLNVINAPANEPLYARLYPSGEKLAPGINEQKLTEVSAPDSSHMYSGTFELDEPVIQGYVHIWVDEAENDTTARRELVVDYAMGGNPGGRRSRSGGRRSRSGGRRSRSSPAVSSDGQVMLFGDNLEFAEGEFYTMQTATNAGDVPAWTTPVGQAYRISASPNAPDLEETSISIGYQQSDVPDGEEQWLRIYYRPFGGEWKRLDNTLLDTNQKMASAPTQGPGLYMIMSSIEIPLTRAGWNLFSYPVSVKDGRPVEQAMASIQNESWLLYSYEPEDSSTGWKLYANNYPDVPDELQPLLHTLERLHFAQGYWMYVTRALSVYLKGASQEEEEYNNALVSGIAPEPPATFYGTLPVSGSVQAGTKITAWISETGQLCGEGTLQQVGEDVGFVIHVLADGPENGEPGAQPGCGTTDRTVEFKIEGEEQPRWVLPWDNTRLMDVEGFKLYLPLARR